MTLLVFTPTYDDLLRPETGASLRAQETHVPFVWEVSRHNPYPGRNMQNVVAQYQRARAMLLSGGYEALLTVEHDMVLPPDAIQKLYDTDAPVVYGVYLLRHGTPTLSAWRYENKRNLGMSLSLYPKEIRQYREQGWGEVCGVGWGCTLIRREVLEQIDIYASSDTDAGDIQFAVNCVRAGIRQIARFDVPCGHLTNGRELQPFENGGGAVGRVLALQNVVAAVEGNSLAMKKGRYYTIPLDVAQELQRAGYVRITNDEHEGEVETATVEPVVETAVAPAAKRSKKRAS